jgi:hypothetical protein
MVQDDRHALRWRQRGHRVRDSIHRVLAGRGVGRPGGPVTDIADQVERFGGAYPVDPVQPSWARQTR